MLFEIVKLGSNIVFESTTHVSSIDFTKLNQKYIDGYRARVDGVIIGRPEHVKAAVQRALNNPKPVKSPIATYVAQRDAKMATINRPEYDVPRSEAHQMSPMPMDTVPEASASDVDAGNEALAAAAEKEVKDTVQHAVQSTAIDTSTIFGPDDDETDGTPTAFVTGMCTQEEADAAANEPVGVTETASDVHRSVDGEILVSGIRCVNDSLCFKNQSACAKYYGFDSALLSDALKKNGYVKKVDKTFEKF